MRRRVPHFATLILAILLTACGGGGGGYNGGGPSPSTPQTPQTPTTPPPPQVSTAEAARLLTQATFGPTDADIAAVQSTGIKTWLAQQMSATAPTSMVAYEDNRLQGLRVNQAGAQLQANHFYEAFWLQAPNNGDQLRERMRFALSQIFVISLSDATVGQNVRGAAGYYDMLGNNAFGNYRTLLEQVTLHPMMGVYLSYLANQKEDAAGTRLPDQNYAREVMQLMSIGLVMLNQDGTQKLDANGKPIPTYSPDDILGLSKVFTGLSWFSPSPSNNTFAGRGRDPNSDIQPMSFYPQFHSTSQKNFLGTTIPATASPDIPGDLKIALDTIFNHPNVGPFMAQRLIQQFVTSNPSPGYVSRVAAVFNDNGSGVRGDLGAVITAVLTDSEARDISVVTSQTFGKLREPVIRLANWIRAFNATSQSGNWTVQSTSANSSLSQSPLTSSSVFNFWRPGYVPPNTQLGSRNLYGPEFQVVDEVSTAGYLNTIQNAIDSGIGTVTGDVRSAYTAELALVADQNALLDRVNKLLLYGQMSANLRQLIGEAVAGITLGNSPTQAQIDAANLNRVKLAIFLTMASPEYLVQR